MAIPEIDKQKLIEHLRGYATSVENGWIPPEGVLANLLILLESYGYLRKSGEIYVRKISRRK